MFVVVESVEYNDRNNDWGIGHKLNENVSSVYESVWIEILLFYVDHFLNEAIGEIFEEHSS